MFAKYHKTNSQAVNFYPSRECKDNEITTCTQTLAQLQSYNIHYMHCTTSTHTHLIHTLHPCMPDKKAQSTGPNTNLKTLAHVCLCIISAQFIIPHTWLYKSGNESAISVQVAIMPMCDFKVQALLCLLMKVRGKIVHQMTYCIHMASLLGIICVVKIIHWGHILMISLLLGHILVIKCVTGIYYSDQMCYWAIF